MDTGAMAALLNLLGIVAFAFLLGVVVTQRRTIRRLMQTQIDRQSAAIREAESNA